MRILLYIYGRLVGSELLCQTVKKCHKRDLPGIMHCVNAARRAGGFSEFHIAYFERALSGQ